VGLAHADLFQSSPAAGAARESISASHSPTVADWLRTIRKISDTEIARMHARETSRGMAVAFPYQRADGHTIYEKVRLIGAKKFWRIPAGTPSLLYGLPAADTTNGRAIITEGELDVHALRSMGIDPVVSVPDGTGSQLTPELLTPLERFAEILIATDADEPGEKLARRLAEALGPARCWRLRFSDRGKTFKDAGDALNAGWTRAQFDAAIGAAKTCDTTPSNDNALDDNPYRVVGGGFATFARTSTATRPFSRSATSTRRSTNRARATTATRWSPTT
jgi:twinkle protein